MDPQYLSTESKHPLPNSHEIFPKDQEVHSQYSTIQNDGLFTKEDQFNQLKEPLLAQPIQISFPYDPKLEESKTVLKKVQEIDKRLGEGWFFAYQLWLYFIMVAVPSKGVFSVASVQDFWSRPDKFLAKVCSVLLVFALFDVFWSVKQAWLHQEALKKKDEKIAAKAFTSVVRLAIYYLILCVVFFLVAIFWGYYYSGYGKDRSYWINGLFILLLQFITHYVIPVGISIYGSYRMKILLEEKRDLLLKTGNGDSNSS